MQPSTEWHEVVGEDEVERHARFSEQIGRIQARVSRRHGAGRSFHRKPIAGLHGRFTVAAALPEPARHGICAESGSFDAVVRMSNGAVVPRPDFVPDIRGLAVSLRGMDAPGVLTDRTDRQDFLLINRPAFGFRDSVGFAEIMEPSMRGQVALMEFLVSRHGVVGGPLELSRIARDVLRPFTGFATATFYSAAPISWGPYAAHVRAVPVGAKLNPMAARDWAADVAGRLREGALTYRFEVCYFTDEEHTPIEDGRVRWPGPWVPVGRLAIPSQQIADVESEAFDPWACLVEHRPLGEIMRARKVAYFPSAQARLKG